VLKTMKRLARASLAAALTVAAVVVSAPGAHATVNDGGQSLIGVTYVAVVNGELIVSDSNGPTLLDIDTGRTGLDGSQNSTTLRIGFPRNNGISNFASSRPVPLGTSCHSEIAPPASATDATRISFVVCPNVTGAIRVYLNGGDDGVTFLVGNTHPKFVDGGDGNDGLYESGITSPTTFYGGNGNDRVSFVLGNGRVYLNGGPGDDSLQTPVTASGSVLDGGPGNDTLWGVGGPLIPGNGSLGLVLDPNAPGDMLIGGDGNDTINASDRPDGIDGGAGNDVIEANGGNDTVVGGTGSDTIRAGKGADTVYARDGVNDKLVGCGDGTHDRVQIDVVGAVGHDTNVSGCESKF
jgi:Ca2+-binding RTX toxin-like protein